MKTVLSIAALAAISSFATAQTRQLVKPLRVQLNVIFPSSDVKNATSSTGFGLGVSYDFYESAVNDAGNYFRLGAYLGYDQSNGNGITFSQVPILAQGRYYFSGGGDSSATSIYGLLGLGAYYNRVSGAGSDSKTTFGFKLGLGAEFSQSLYGELAYNFPGKFNGANVDYLALSIGYRF